ncbi:putative LRR receptor-like serine/threonine-protein kinase [Cucumis melo var. makuwa]|uniref:Putative LRR receptor-like serine/threonine-protein kinase n=1 Tax=Cucumis melo var. makuwa TaxID=1194695 RepID=A0A5D3BSH4_CUCMM|nr:putative LRR receptor-like serine/threonine-protein kinase [Cucumis melo var. makuwa]
MASSSLGFIFVLCAIVSIVSHLIISSQAQNSTQPITDPDQGAWNISGNLCSGRAVDSTTRIDSNGNLNPLIKCDCPANGGATCLITQLYFSLSLSLSLSLCIYHIVYEELEYFELVFFMIALSIHVCTHVYAINVVGVLPPELWTLTSLTYLKLDQNFLTGTLSASVGNLSELRTLSLGINGLSGELPKELGSLSKLELLALGSNNFSGPLPSELGNLSMLREL